MSSQNSMLIHVLQGSGLPLHILAWGDLSTVGQHLAPISSQDTNPKNSTSFAGTILSSAGRKVFDILYAKGNTSTTTTTIYSIKNTYMHCCQCKSLLT